MRLAPVLIGSVALFQVWTPVVRPPWEVLEIWVSAVERHTPGTSDSGVRMLLDLRTFELESAFPHLTRVLSAAIRAEGRDPRFDAFLKPYSTERIRDVDQPRFEAIVRKIHVDGVDRFLKRAAALHAGIAIIEPDAHRSSRAGTSQLAADGRNAGEEGRVWHWMLGRAFLHLLPRVSEDPDALIWYQAVGVHLLESRSLTEANPHLDRAMDLFPGDAEILFLRGFLHEAQGSPDIQAAMEEMAARVAGERGTRYVRSVRSEAEENEQARAAYAKALKADPRHREARIHHARLLILAGRAGLAASELRAVLDGLDDRTLRYYALLFLGQAEQSEGRLPDARAAFEAAVRLFPDAQSPRLALAEVALQSGNREDARALFDFLATATDQDEDPWWRYYPERVPNRHEWLKRMWAAFEGAVR